MKISDIKFLQPIISRFTVVQYIIIYSFFLSNKQEYRTKCTTCTAELKSNIIEDFSSSLHTHCTTAFSDHLQFYSNFNSMDNFLHVIRGVSPLHLEQELPLKFFVSNALYEIKNNAKYLNHLTCGKPISRPLNGQ